jgi:transposase
MARLALDRPQRDALERLRAETKDARVYRNATIILGTADRLTKQALAASLGCSAATIDRIRRRYRATGPDGLVPTRPPGRPSRATPGYRAELERAIRTPPQDLGYGFSTWSAARLAQHLKRSTGIAPGVDQIRRILHRCRYSIQRPKHTMRGKRDEAEFERAKAELEELERAALRPDAAEMLIYQDETEIHRHPTLCRIRAPVGQQPRVPAPGKNEKQVVYGGVDYVTGKITYTVAATKSGPHFLAFLVALVAAYAGRKIRLVCDNGRFHTTKAVAAWLEAHREEVEIYWLPPYCPSLNRIERLWGHLKRTVLANVLFATLEDLVAAFRKGVGQINGHRQKMGFMFRHEARTSKAA